jgi:hypothetical protein
VSQLKLWAGGAKPFGQTKSGSLSAAARKRHLALTDDVERFVGELTLVVDSWREISGVDFRAAAIWAYKRRAQAAPPGPQTN